MSVVFSSFCHQCQIALFLCSFSESLGVSADKKEAVSWMWKIKKQYQMHIRMSCGEKMHPVGEGSRLGSWHM